MMKNKNIDKFKSLIRPVSNEDLYPHIQELTHISSEELRVHQVMKRS